MSATVWAIASLAALSNFSGVTAEMISLTYKKTAQQITGPYLILL
jgi:hypothetical protein